MAALLLTAACSTDEVAEAPVTPPYDGGSVAIGFDAAVTDTAQTRATGVIDQATTLAQQGGFGVFCIYSGSNALSDAETSGDTITILNNVNVTGTYNNSILDWSYSPKRFWPPLNQQDKDKTGSKKYLSFFTYAPYLTRTSATDVDAETPMRLMYGTDDKFQYKIQYFLPDDPSKQRDLLWGSDANGDQMTDWYCDPNYSTTETEIDAINKKLATANVTKNGSLPITFHHSTAKLTMQIKHTYGEIDTRYQKIFVKEVVLGNINNKGVLNLRTEKNEDGTWGTTGKWEKLSPEDHKVTFTRNGTPALSNAIAYNEDDYKTETGVRESNSSVYSGEFYMLPKVNKGNTTNQMYVTVTYVFVGTSANDNNYIGEEITTTSYIDQDIEPNKSYQLNITLAPTMTVKLTPLVWDKAIQSNNAGNSNMVYVPNEGEMKWAKKTSVKTDTYIYDETGKATISTSESGSVDFKDMEGNSSTIGLNYYKENNYKVETKTENGVETRYRTLEKVNTTIGILRCEFTLYFPKSKYTSCNAALAESKIINGDEGATSGFSFCNEDGSTDKGTTETLTLTDATVNSIEYKKASGTLYIKYDDTNKSQQTETIVLRVTVNDGTNDYRVYGLTGSNAFSEYTISHSYNETDVE